MGVTVKTLGCLLGLLSIRLVHSTCPDPVDEKYGSVIDESQSDCPNRYETGCTLRILCKKDYQAYGRSLHFQTGAIEKMVCREDGKWSIEAPSPVVSIWPGVQGDDSKQWLLCIPMCYMPEFNRTEFDTYKIVKQPQYFEYGQYVDLYRDNKLLIYLPENFPLTLQCQPRAEWWLDGFDNQPREFRCTGGGKGFYWDDQYELDLDKVCVMTCDRFNYDNSNNQMIVNWENRTYFEASGSVFDGGYYELSCKDGYQLQPGGAPKQKFICEGKTGVYRNAATNQEATQKYTCEEAKASGCPNFKEKENTILERSNCTTAEFVPENCFLAYDCRDGYYPTDVKYLYGGGQTLRCDGSHWVAKEKAFSNELISDSMDCKKGCARIKVKDLVELLNNVDVTIKLIPVEDEAGKTHQCYDIQTIESVIKFKGEVYEKSNKYFCEGEISKNETDSSYNVALANKCPESCQGFDASNAPEGVKVSNKPPKFTYFNETYVGNGEEYVLICAAGYVREGDKYPNGQRVKCDNGSFTDQETGETDVKISPCKKACELPKSDDVTTITDFCDSSSGKCGIQAHCKPGYTINGTTSTFVNFTCDKDSQKWVDTSSNVKLKPDEIICVNPNPQPVCDGLPPNSTTTTVRTFCDSSSPPKCGAEISCPLGYFIAGTTTSHANYTCDNDSNKWIDTATNLEAKPDNCTPACAQPNPNQATTKISMVCDTSSPPICNGMLVDCVPGYVINGTSTEHGNFTCNKDNHTWVDTNTQVSLLPENIDCVKPTCELPNPDRNTTTSPKIFCDKSSPPKCGVDIKCEEGFYLTGTNSSHKNYTCDNDSNQWIDTGANVVVKPEDMTCPRCALPTPNKQTTVTKICDAPPACNGISVVCEQGYVINGTTTPSANFTCNKDTNNWVDTATNVEMKPKDINCVQPKCQLPTPNNSTTNSTSVFCDLSSPPKCGIDIKCKPGFYLNGTKSSHKNYTCDNDSNQWIDTGANVVVKPEDINCTAVVEGCTQPNSNKETTVTKICDTSSPPVCNGISVECIPGYVINGTSTPKANFTCNKDNNTWIETSTQVSLLPASIICVQPECELPQPKNNVTSVKIFCDTSSPPVCGAVLDCPEGFYVSSTTTSHKNYTCDNDSNEWVDTGSGIEVKPKNMTCEPICAIPEGDNVTTTVTKYCEAEVCSVINVDCKPGYIINGTSSPNMNFTCNGDNKTWVNTDAQVSLLPEYIKCVQPGDCTQPNSNKETTVTKICDTTSPPVCNGISVECIPGYVINGTTTPKANFTCNKDNNTWTNTNTQVSHLPEDIKCIQPKCELPTPEHTKENSTRLFCDLSSPPKCGIDIACEPGFYLTGTKTSHKNYTCDNDSNQWIDTGSGIEVKPENMTCKPICAIPEGDNVTTTVTKYCEAEVCGVINVNCKPGYIINGTSSPNMNFTCNGDNSTWVNTNAQVSLLPEYIKCVKPPCDPPFTNSTTTSQPNVFCDLSSPPVCGMDIKCKPGYYLYRTTTTYTNYTCNVESGKWTQDGAEAELKDICVTPNCTQPTPDKETTTVTKICDETSLCPGITVVCKPGYVIKGTTTSHANFTCDGEGDKWVDTATAISILPGDITCVANVTTTPAPTGQCTISRDDVTITVTTTVSGNSAVPGEEISLKCKDKLVWNDQSTDNTAETHKFKCLENGNWKSEETGREYPKIPDSCSCHKPNVPQYINSSFHCEKTKDVFECNIYVICIFSGYVFKGTSSKNTTLTCTANDGNWKLPETGAIYEEEDFVCLREETTTTGAPGVPCIYMWSGSVNYTKGKNLGMNRYSYNTSSVLELHCPETTPIWDPASASNPEKVHKYECLPDGTWKSLETGLIHKETEDGPAIRDACVGCTAPAETAGSDLTNICTATQCILTINCTTPGQFVKNTTTPTKEYKCDPATGEWVDKETNVHVPNKDIVCEGCTHCPSTTRITGSPPTATPVKPCEVPTEDDSTKVTENTENNVVVVTVECKDKFVWNTATTNNSAPKHEYECKDGKWIDKENGDQHEKIIDRCAPCLKPESKVGEQEMALYCHLDNSCSLNFTCGPGYFINGTELTNAFYVCDKLSHTWIDLFGVKNTTLPTCVSTEATTKPSGQCTINRDDKSLTVTTTNSGNSAVPGEEISLKCKDKLVWNDQSTDNTAEIHKFKCLENGNWKSEETGREYPKIPDTCSCHRPNIGEPGIMPEFLFNTSFHCGKQNGLLECNFYVICIWPGLVLNGTSSPNATLICSATDSNWKIPETGAIYEDKDFVCVSQPATTSTPPGSCEVPKEDSATKVTENTRNNVHVVTIECKENFIWDTATTSNNASKHEYECKDGKWISKETGIPQEKIIDRCVPCQISDLKSDVQKVEMTCDANSCNATITCGNGYVINGTEYVNHQYWCDKHTRTWIDPSGLHNNSLLGCVSETTGSTTLASSTTRSSVSCQEPKNVEGKQDVEMTCVADNCSVSITCGPGYFLNGTDKVHLTYWCDKLTEKWIEPSGLQNTTLPECIPDPTGTPLLTTTGAPGKCQTLEEKEGEQVVQMTCDDDNNCNATITCGPGYFLNGTDKVRLTYWCDNLTEKWIEPSGLQNTTLPKCIPDPTGTPLLTTTRAPGVCQNPEEKTNVQRVELSCDANNNCNVSITCGEGYHLNGTDKTHLVYWCDKLTENWIEPSGLQNTSLPTCISNSSCKIPNVDSTVTLEKNGENEISLTCKPPLNWDLTVTSNPAPVHKYKCLGNGSWESQEDKKLYKTIPDRCTGCDEPVTTIDKQDVNRTCDDSNPPNCTVFITCGKGYHLNGTILTSSSFYCDVLTRTWINNDGVLNTTLLECVAESTSSPGTVTPGTGSTASPLICNKYNPDGTVIVTEGENQVTIECKPGNSWDWTTTNNTDPQHVWKCEKDGKWTSRKDGERKDNIPDTCNECAKPKTVEGVQRVDIMCDNSKKPIECSVTITCGDGYRLEGTTITYEVFYCDKPSHNWIDGSGLIKTPLPTCVSNSTTTVSPGTGPTTRVPGGVCRYEMKDNTVRVVPPPEIVAARRAADHPTQPPYWEVKHGEDIKLTCVPDLQWNPATTSNPSREHVYECLANGKWKDPLTGKESETIPDSCACTAPNEQKEKPKCTTDENGQLKCEMHLTCEPVDNTGDNCGLNAIFPTEDKCWRKWKDQDLSKVCHKDSKVAKWNKIYHTFVAGSCICGEEYEDVGGNGDSGFFCKLECPPDSPNVLACTGENQCQVDTTNQNKTFCGCNDGFNPTGTGQCRAATDACDSCKHNCHIAQKCQSSGNSHFHFTCSKCDENMGFTSVGGGGKGCNNINECLNGKHNCDINAQCIDRDPSFDSTFGQKYACVCRDGWRGNGTKCSPCQDVNECVEKPGICGKNAICTNTPGSYTCACKPGYEPGPQSSNGINRDCVDTNECLKPLSCLPNSKCNNTEGSYECPCIPGYIGNGKPDKEGCIVDPAVCDLCDKRSTQCKLNAEGTKYECICNEHHVRIDQYTCKPKTYCDKPEQVKCAPPPKGICRDFPDGSGYDCVCAEGYTGNGTTCIEIDICQRESPCRYIANTICVSDKQDPFNKYQCHCKPGYIRQIEGQGNFSAPCFEENAYMANNCTSCDPKSEFCFNETKVEKPGSLVSCQCKDGYERGVDGKCKNINECLKPELNDCDPVRAVCDDLHPAENADKKYRCTCKAGYTGAGTVNTCSNINECVEQPNICKREGEECRDLTPHYECYCKDGFQMVGDRCEDVNECVMYLHNCNPHSDCNNTIGSYFCSCKPGFRENGTKNGHPTCISIDQCKEGYLGTGKPVCDKETENCVTLLGTYECHCKEGYTRINNVCVDNNECRDRQTHQCDESTTVCDNLPGTYQCLCKDGFERDTNRTCKDIDECATGKAACHPNSHCKNLIGTYRCMCDEGFQPVRNTIENRPVCERIKVCSTNPFICNGGVCVDTEEDPFFRCECPVGTVAYNNTVCIDQRYCEINATATGEWPCPDHAKCLGAGKCQCEVGYQWQEIDHPLTLEKIKTRKCVEINWCDTVGKTKCKGMKCRNTPEKAPGTGECFCDNGFEIDPITKKCANINECVLKKDICPKNSECYDTTGSYTCECKSGYRKEKGSTATNPVCINVNECELQMDNCTEYTNTVCHDNEGSFTCDCLPGYKRDQIGNDKLGEGHYANRGCIDIDECEKEVCDEIAECHNCPGSFTCQCPEGFDGVGTIKEPCQNINECALNIHNCTLLENCIDTKGAFKCECKPGYERKGDRCEDINECYDKPCKDNMTCKNTVGSYLCNCPVGLFLNEKTGKCDDINECSLQVCPEGPGDICVNTFGSYVCDCRKGWEKPCKTNVCKEACKNINECASPKACGPGTNCTDTQGSYECICKNFHTGDPYSAEGCKLVDICTREPCKGEHEVCKPVNELVRECVCAPGFLKEKEVCKKDPCTEKKCSNGGTCRTSIYDGKLNATCICPNNMIEDPEKDECIPSDVCQCGAGKNNCTGSPKCSDPNFMFCFSKGTKPDCRCFDYLRYNNATQKCEERNPCEPNLCPKHPFNATCSVIKDPETKLNRSFVCECPPGYRWWKNEEVVLSPGECKPDIDCSLENYCQNKPHMECDKVGHVCVCIKDYHYDNATDRCIQVDPCQRKEQLTGKPACPPKSYQDGRDGKTCQCNCEPGYEKYCHPNGTEECIDVNECERGQPCLNNVTHPECANTDGSYQCKCGAMQPNYHVKDGACVPIDYCDMRQVMCSNFSSCVPDTGICECQTGFEKEPGCQEHNCTCHNIDECQRNAYACMPHALCVDQIGNYTCECLPGYEKGPGSYGNFDFLCVDKNECLTNPCPNNSICHNSEGTYHCECLFPLIQHSRFDCAYNTTEGCTDKCVQHAHCIRLSNEATTFNCTCDYGYDGVGNVKCESRDFCGLDKPCGPNTECKNATGDYTCICLPGYTGNGKDNKTGCTKIDYCAPQYNPCPERADCHLLNTSQPDYDVTNPKSWTNCTCKMTGVEFNRQTFQCEDINECARCKEYAHCPCPKDATKCINTQGSFQCECPPGFEYNVVNNKCEDIDECKTGASVTCQPQYGTCENTPGSWKCNCKPGYKNTINQFSCEKYNECGTEVDHCVKNTTICVDRYPGIFCQCRPGYQRYEGIESSCVNIDECSLEKHSCDRETEVCVDLIPDWKCICANGYERNDNGKCVPSKPCDVKCPQYSKCVINREDKPECRCYNYYDWIPSNETCSALPCEQTAHCPEHSKCHINQDRNNTGVILSYVCICDHPYIMDSSTGLCNPPRTSRSPDICSAANCGIGSCENTETPPYYKCNCPGGNCQVQTCKDKRCAQDAKCVEAVGEKDAYCVCNEGSTGMGTRASPCYPISGCREIGCSVYAACKPQDGETKCVCDSHYRGNGTWCTDINECTENLHNCDENAICTNSEGGFSCACKPGFKGQGTKSDCHDINECLPSEGALMLCDDVSTICNNTIGSYHCDCKPGFENQSFPFFKCEDTDECLKDKEHKLCGAIHTCVNTIPGYECKCAPGYEQSADKKKCLDIDECFLKTHDCHPQAKCTNVPGSFICNCTEGYDGDGKKTCSLIDKCSDPKLNNCDADSTTCRMLSDKPIFMCDCKGGFKPPAGQSEYHICDDIDECTDGSVDYDPSTTGCNNTKGGYKLYCLKGRENTHPNPSDHNVKCTNLNECAQDPAFKETMAIINSGTFDPNSWNTTFVPPKDNNSAYANCYWAAIYGQKFANVLLPMCMDLEPSQKMSNFPLLKPSPNFDKDIIGYTCACPFGDLPIMNEGMPNARPNCGQKKCECLSDTMMCDRGTCICKNPVESMRNVSGQLICTATECSNGEPFPEYLMNKMLDCKDNKWVAKPGYQLVRDQYTKMVIDVIDIDECAAPVNPCCNAQANCTGSDCVKCTNTAGSYTCQMSVGGGICDMSTVDKDNCKCGSVICHETQAWYYRCGVKCNATDDPRLEKPEYNQKLCSKFVDGDKYITLNSLKDLYQRICSVNTDANSNLYACFFNKDSDDLTKSPLFNYWGECQFDAAKVKCLDGGVPKQHTDFLNGTFCPTRGQLPPATPAVGQPVSQTTYPMDVNCHGSGATSFMSGQFGVYPDGYVIAYDG